MNNNNNFGMTGLWISISIKSLNLSFRITDNFLKRVYVGISQVYKENMYLLPTQENARKFYFRTTSKSAAHEITKEFDKTIFENCCCLEVGTSLSPQIKSLGEMIVIHPINSNLNENLKLIYQEILNLENWRKEENSKMNFVSAVSNTFSLNVKVMDNSQPILQHQVVHTRTENRELMLKSWEVVSMQEFSAFKTDSLTQSSFCITQKKENFIALDKPTNYFWSMLANQQIESQSYSIKSDIPNTVFQKGSFQMKENQTKNDKKTSNHSSNQIPNKVIVLSNLNSFKKALHVYRFCRCFKGLLKILFMKNHKKAFIEFNSIESARLCIQSINVNEKAHKFRADFSKTYRSLNQKSYVGKNSKIHNGWYHVSKKLTKCFPFEFFLGNLSSDVEAILVFDIDQLKNLGLLTLYKMFRNRIKLMFQGLNYPIGNNKIAHCSFIDSKMLCMRIAIGDLLVAIKFISKFESKTSRTRKYTARFCSNPMN